MEMIAAYAIRWQLVSYDYSWQRRPIVVFVASVNTIATCAPSLATGKTSNQTEP